MAHMRVAINRQPQYRPQHITVTPYCRGFQNRNAIFLESYQKGGAIDFQP